MLVLKVKGTLFTILSLDRSTQFDTKPILSDIYLRTYIRIFINAHEYTRKRTHANAQRHIKYAQTHTSLHTIIQEQCI